MPIAPDIAGFKEAQRRSLDLFGSGVTFVVPAAAQDVQWPSGTSFDPETGLPMDPVIEPEGSTGDPTEVPAKAMVIHRPIRGRIEDSSEMTAVGWIESANMALIISPETKARVEHATDVVVFAERQKISEWRPSGLQGVDRWIVFLEGE